MGCKGIWGTASSSRTNNNCRASLCSGDSEADQQQVPRRRTAHPQTNPRRLFGVQSPPGRPARGVTPAPNRTTGRPQRTINRGLVIRQDLLAPVRPGHESDEEAASEADMDAPARGEAGGGGLAGVGLSQRRLGEGGRASPQRGAAALRDVREDFAEGGDPHHDDLMQGEQTPLQSFRCQVLPAPPPVSPVLLSTPATAQPPTPLGPPFLVPAPHPLPHACPASLVVVPSSLSARTPTQGEHPPVPSCSSWSCVLQFWSCASVSFQHVYRHWGPPALQEHIEAHSRRPAPASHRSQQCRLLHTALPQPPLNPDQGCCFTPYFAQPAEYRQQQARAQCSKGRAAGQGRAFVRQGRAESACWKGAPSPNPCPLPCWFPFYCCSVQADAAVPGSPVQSQPPASYSGRQAPVIQLLCHASTCI